MFGLTAIFFTINTFSIYLKVDWILSVNAKGIRLAEERIDSLFKMDSTNSEAKLTTPNSALLTAMVSGSASVSAISGRGHIFKLSTAVNLPPDFPEFQFRTSFNNLPMELMVEIFSYLEYGELLDSRLTCRRWNTVIAACKQSMDKIVFTLVNSKEKSVSNVIKNSILRKSTVPWRNIAVQGYMITDVLNHYFPAHQSLTSLVLYDCIISWDLVKAGIAMLQQLQKLDIAKCTIHLDDSTKVPTLPATTTGFDEFKERVKSLKFAVENLKLLNFFLKEFVCGSGSTVPSLTTLEILVDPEPQSGGNDGASFSPNFINFNIFFPKLVESHCATLKTLKIYTGFSLSRCIFQSIRNFEQMNLKLESFHYKWLDSSTQTLARVTAADETTYVNFIKSQLNLKSVGFPRFASSFDSILSFQELEIGVCGISLSNLILAPVTPLKAIKLGLNESTSLIDSDDENIYSGLAHLSIEGLGLSWSFKHLPRIVVACPNLETLVIGGYHQELKNTSIQTIIRNLPQLRTLDIAVHHSIDDRGVSGVSRSTTKRLLKSKSLYLEQSLEDLGYDLVGVPICSLKHLSKLTLRGRCSYITDVGIHYGFRFPNLKELSIVCGYELSDWGIVQLAKHNPNLERCSVVIVRNTVTPGSRALFQKLLRRCSQNLSLVCSRDAPDSDDDDDDFPVYLTDESE